MSKCKSNKESYSIINIRTNLPVVYYTYSLNAITKILPFFISLFPNKTTEFMLMLYFDVEFVLLKARF